MLLNPKSLITTLNNDNNNNSNYSLQNLAAPHTNMAEGETDEQETLIRADDLQELSVGGGGASDGGGGNGGGGGAGGGSMLPLPSLLQQPPPAWHLPLHCTALVVVAAALVIMLPVYLEVRGLKGERRGLRSLMM